MSNKELQLFRSAEIRCDLEHFYSSLCPPEMREEAEALLSRKVPYFKQYGFKVPLAFSEFFSKYNGIRSEKYVSPVLYYVYIIPFLTDLNIAKAYADKNMYGRLFPNVKQPKPLLHNIRGRFYLPSGEEIGKTQAADLLAKEESFIIKPALDSGQGKNVRLAHGSQLGQEGICALFDEYGADFIVQNVLRQHEEMKRFNESSLNTCRICTYRRVGTGEYVTLGASVRFGGKGEIRDNTCAGGGKCRIEATGEVDDTIFIHTSTRCGSLRSDKGMENVRIPNYDKAVKLCLDLHKTLPNIDLIGWDIAIGEDGDPIFIELNEQPDFIGQLAYGPMFGEYTDELMEHIQHQRKEAKAIVQISYPTAPARHTYSWDLRPL